MKKKDIIYIPGQDKWSEHFPTPGKLRPSNFGHIFGDTNPNSTSYFVPNRN